MNIRIKVCGMTRDAELKQLNDLAIDYAGFIHYKRSARDISEIRLDATLFRGEKIGVFVNHGLEYIERRIGELSLDGIQLHGEESPGFCQKLKEKTKVWKVFPATMDNIKRNCIPYREAVDSFLFDTVGPKKGGHGYSFDWGMLKEYDQSVPFILSGGIGMDTIDNLLGFKHPRWMGIDLNSRFELTPGMKNMELLKEFTESLRSKICK